MLIGSRVSQVCDREIMATGLLHPDSLFHRVFYDSPVGMVITTIDEGRYVQVNPAFAQLLGYAPDELIGQVFPVLGLVHEEERAMVMDVLRRTGKLGDIPLLLRTQTGEIRTAIGSVQMEEIGGQHYLVSMLQDLTDHERVQNALQSAETRFHLFFQGIPLPLIVYDATRQNILDVNPAACRVYGYSHDEFTQMTVADLRPPEEAKQPGIRQPHRPHRGSSRIGPERHLGKDGRIMDVDIVSYAFDLDGRPARLSIVQDVSEQRAIDNALRANEERLRIVADVTTDAVWDRDLTTNEVEWNHGLGVLFGFRLAEDRPHDWWLNHVHPDEREGVEASIEEAFASDRNFWTAEYRFRHAAGDYVNVLDRGYIVRDEQGRAVRFIGAMVDITVQLQIAKAAARAAQDERQRLARNLHDAVTQSLYSSSLMAEAARRHAVNNQLEASVDYITRLGSLSQQALRQLRLLVYQLRPATLEQEGLVNALRYRLEAVEQRAGVRVRLIEDGDEAIPPPMQSELFWIAQEALDNALKHANATATTITVKQTPDEVWLEIADNGCGFVLDGPPHDGAAGLQRLRERVDRLGGILEVQSQPGSGSLVRARLALRNGSARR